MLADGTQVPCGPWKNPDLFWATVGGMGLTGIVSRVTLQLIPIETASIMAQHFKAPDLDTVFRWLDDREHDDQYTVAWIDCLSRGKSLGRSVLIRGHHATQAEAPSATLEVTTRRTLPMPYDLPSFAVNRWSVAAFNQLYYTIEGRKTKPFLVDFDKFFYPLDLIQNWNRMYGRRGFLQYQFMIPEPGAADGSRRILERLAESRRSSFLAVLKRFGPGNIGPLSFPDRGYTLTLDLAGTDAGVFRLLDELGDMVIKYGGRVYLAKDARLDPERFRQMYGRLNEWLCLKEQLDPHGRFSSDLSRRLRLDTPAHQQESQCERHS